MLKKDIILISVILVVMIILLFLGYQDYKRQKAIALQRVGNTQSASQVATLG